MNMFGFVTKRLTFTLFSIPIIIWLMLFLARLSPVDPVEQLIDANDFSTDKISYAEIYARTSKKHELNLPSFYFSLTKSNYQAAFYQLANPLQKDFYRRLLDENYAYKDIEKLYETILPVWKSNEEINFFEEQKNTTETLKEWQSLAQESAHLKSLHTQLAQLNQSKTISHSLLPRFIWHGSENRFHSSFKKLFSFQWGNSLIDGKSAKTKIFSALKLTLLLMLMSLIVAYGLGIPLGIWFHRSKNKITSTIESFLYVLKSLPLFVFALLMLSTFTTAEISPLLKIFPAVNAYGWAGQSSFWEKLATNINQLILPTICIALYSIAYIARQVKTSLNRENRELYNTTSKMKGLSPKAIFSHRFRNIRGILITMIGNGIIGSFSGTLIIEYIFNIPGMGRLLLNSIRQNDLNVLLPIVLLLFIISSVVLLTSDLLYRKYNPKIAFQDA